MQDWELIGFVSSSEPRFKVLVHLTKQASTPTNMAIKYAIPISRVSTAIKELMEKELVECLTPDRRKGKIYKATQCGEDVVRMMHEFTDIGD
jgi:predicted transcriptional regulator